MVFQNIIHYSWARIFRRLFSKRCTFGSKSGTKSLVRRYQAKFTQTVSEYLEVCHIWLIKFLKILCRVIFFIHVIQLSLFRSEYLPFTIYHLPGYRSISTSLKSYLTKDLDQTWHLPCIFHSMILNYSHEES